MPRRCRDAGDHHDRRHGHHLAGRNVRGHRSDAREAADRFWRTVPDAQLPPDWPRRDDEPRHRWKGARKSDLRPAWVTGCGAPRDEQTDPPGAGPRRSAIASMRTTMRPFGDTISLEQARALIDGALRPIERIERVPLQAAHGRVLAQDAVANADVPPFSRAAMDGYAVRAADTSGATAVRPAVLACIEKVFTGQMPSRSVGAGECIELSTGARMPSGAAA